jgi:hypothetical protein
MYAHNLLPILNQYFPFKFTCKAINFLPKLGVLKVVEMHLKVVSLLLTATYALPPTPSVGEIGDKLK